jgi:hypothetical protein
LSLNCVLGTLFLSFWCSQSAHCESNATVPVSKEVIALRETVVALTGDPDINSAIDMFTALQVRVIGAANDSTWKRDNPNWTSVFNIVHDDLSRDVGLLLLAQVRDMTAHWDRELTAHLTPSQIGELVKFYRSDLGRRYVAFQKRLIAIQEEGLSGLVVGLAAGGPDPHRVPVPATIAQIDSRKNVAALSWVYLMMTALGPTGSPGRPSSASEEKIVNDMMADALAKMRGPELDQLNAQYHGDLAAFATFQGSPVARALILIYGFVAKDIQADPAAPGIAFAAGLQRSIEQHTPEWKAAYEAGRSAPPLAR